MEVVGAFSLWGGGVPLLSHGGDGRLYAWNEIMGMVVIGSRPSNFVPRTVARRKWHGKGGGTMTNYAQLRYAGACVLAVATMLTIVVPALMELLNAVETAGKSYETATCKRQA